MQRLLWMVGAVGLGLVIVGATQAGSPDQHNNSGNNQSNNTQNNNNQGNNKQSGNNQNNNNQSNKQDKYPDKTPNSNSATSNLSPGLTVGGLNLKNTETPLQKLNLGKSVVDPANKGAALHEGLNGSGTPLGGIISSAKNKHAADKAVTDAQAAKAAADKAYDDAQSAAAISRQQLGSASAV